jgi:uncharacterized protein (TIGR02145 family)
MSVFSVQTLLSNNLVRGILALGIPLLLYWVFFPAHLHWNFCRFALSSPAAYQRHVEKFPNSPYREKAAWHRAKQLEEADVYAQFAEEFPDSKNHELALWKAASMFNTREAYWEYFSKYPAGKIAVQYKGKIAPYKAAAYKYSQEQQLAAKLNYGEIQDPEGNKYRTINLSGKTWMADNINLSTATGSHCFGSHENYCLRFGRLYYWETAQKICSKLGPGWRLPSDAEWDELATTYGGGKDWDGAERLGKRAYRELSKSGRSGFAGLNGGRINSDGKFDNVYFAGYYWTSTTLDIRPEEAYMYVFDYQNRQIVKGLDSKTAGLSCRCVKDATNRVVQ